jgi:hypothetical protein
MQVYLFIDDIYDVQAATLGDWHWLSFLTRHLCPDSDGHRSPRRDIACRRRLWLASFPPFPPNDWLTVLREVLLVPLARIP